MERKVDLNMKYIVFYISYDINLTWRFTIPLLLYILAILSDILSERNWEISPHSLKKRMSVPDCPNICQRSWNDIYGYVRVVCTYLFPQCLLACHTMGTKSLCTTALKLRVAWLEYYLNECYLLIKILDDLVTSIVILQFYNFIRKNLPFW